MTKAALDKDWSNMFVKSPLRFAVLQYDVTKSNGQRIGTELHESDPAHFMHLNQENRRAHGQHRINRTGCLHLCHLLTRRKWGRWCMFQLCRLPWTCLPPCSIHKADLQILMEFYKFEQREWISKSLDFVSHHLPRYNVIWVPSEQNSSHDQLLAHETKMMATSCQEILRPIWYFHIFWNIFYFATWYRRLDEELEVPQHSVELGPKWEYFASRRHGYVLKVMSVPLHYMQTVNTYRQMHEVQASEFKKNVEDAIIFLRAVSRQRTFPDKLSYQAY